MATHGASSSSVVSLGKYDVFLSFRGEDTRKNFTSHLYNALEKKQIKTFIDNEELQKGDELSPKLMKAIEESLASIVIFSENYATSKWCLKEIVKILECKKDQGQIVLPVFYNIDPSHVRNQTGSYGKAFEKHEKDLELNEDQLQHELFLLQKGKKKGELQQWKAALTELGNLGGWDSQERNEYDLITEIVEDVFKKLKHRYSFEVKGLVGIEKNRDEIESLLEIESNVVRVVGIWGMGGVGKTTLAKAVCAKLCSQFDGYCFLENVREELKMHGLNVVRHRLFSALLEDKNLRLDAPFVENPSFMTKLARKKVFVVLDNVETLQQIQDLLINDNSLGLGSRVIVTTRDRHICSQFDKCQIYKLENLNPEESLQLFCLNAFREKHPKVGYEELSKRVIAYCKGNPLALRVLGANLNRFDSKEEWKSELEKLQKIPDVNIHEVLKMSYDVLDRTQKDIFLDIACFKFLRRWQKGKVTSLLDACGYFASSGIPVLQGKALITISSDDKIEMHDLIEEMGREIVNQESTSDPGKRSRLWKNEEVDDVLKNNKGTDAVEGIVIDENIELSSDSFKGMTNLRYLEILRTVKFRGDELGCLSNKLRYLRWDVFPFESLPPTISAENLIMLEIDGNKLRKLWDGVQNLQHLKEITLDFCEELIEIPDLSEAPKLEKVSLAFCESLRHLHPSIFSLPKLTYLDLVYCEKIESLNIRSKSLQQLDLTGCSSLTEFSVTSKKMTHLSLRGTAIRELSSSIWHNSKLIFLGLKGCKKLNMVEKKLSNDPRLRSLTKLNLSGCTQLDTLNLSFILDAVQSLESLVLNGCHNLEALPDNIQHHSKLARLVLDKYEKPVYPPIGLRWLSDRLRFLKWKAFPLEHLPSTFCGEMLVELYMPRSKLKKLWDGVQNLVNLKIIDLRWSEDLLEIPDLSMAPKLEKLNLYGCEKIKCLTSSIRLKYLRELCLSCCTSLIEFSVTSEEMTCLSLSGTAIHEFSSSIWHNSRLTYLGLNGCDKLNMVRMKLSNDPQLGSLTNLDLSACTQLDTLNLSFILDAIQSLESLVLNGCRNLEALPDNIQNHSKLARLELDLCEKPVYPPLEHLPSTFCGEMLVELYMPGSNLKKLWDGVQILVNLKIINLRWSVDLLEIPNLSMAPKLEELDLSGCRKIKCLTSNIHLKYLRRLCLVDCSSLIECSVTSEEMTDLSLNGTAIRELSSSIWHNSKLTYLGINGCNKLNMVEKKLSNDPRLGSLTKLNLSGCTQMDALNLSFILDAIQSLQLLQLNGCRNLKALPDNIQNHSKLRGLALDECRKLVFSPTQLPPSLRVLSAANCAYLDTDSVLRLMLENVFQNIKNVFQNMTSERHDDDVDENVFQNIKNMLQNMTSERHEDDVDDDDDDAVVVVDDDDVDDDDDYDYDDDDDDDDDYDYNGIFLLSPGAQVPVGIFNFQTTEASITTHPISTSGLHAFIFCIVLSEGVHLELHGFNLQCVFYENNKEVKIDRISLPYGRSQTLKSDHVLIGWQGYKYNRQESGGDHCNISFQFDFQLFSEEEEEIIWSWKTKGINGCGVIPVYALKHGSDLYMPSATTSTSSIREEIVEQVSHDESDQHLEIDNDELQPRKVGVSTKENQDEKQRFSSSRSRKEEEEEEEEDLNVKSSWCSSIGLLLRRLLGGSNQ